MKFKAITIKDIAKALGISVSSVSRALRDSYEISEPTKKKVREYANQHNYRPNPIALSLKERKTRSIGVVFPEIANTFFSQVIDGIESVAYKRNYNVIITQSKESADREDMILHYLTSRSIDGLIISVSANNTDSRVIKNLHAEGVPIVFVDRIFDDIDTHKVIVDNQEAAYQATSHLIQNGYKNIAAIGNNKNLSITLERLEGYKKALNKNNLHIPDYFIQYCEHGGLVIEEVKKAIDNLLKPAKKPDALVLLSDRITTESFKYLQSKGIKIPDKIGLIGFNNSAFAEMLTPSLSTIQQPAFQMGETAALQILEIIESKRPVTRFEIIVLPPTIIERQSSKKG